MSEVKIEVVIRFSALRFIQKNNMTQKEFAYLCGLNYKNLSDFLNNCGNVKCTTINAIFTAIGVDLNILLEYIYAQIEAQAKRKAKRVQ